MNGYERWRYKLYRKVKGIKVGSKYSGVQYYSSMHRNK